MTFPFNVYLLAWLGGLIAAASSLPAWRAWCVWTGHVDDPGHRKIHDRPIPLAGGLAVLTGLVVPLAAGALCLLSGLPSRRPSPTSASLMHPIEPFAADLFAYGFERRALQLAAIFAGALGMATLGWLDDRHELKPGWKFAGQLLVAGLVAAAGVRITLFVPSLAFSYAVTILWILTVTNACNFMDNMNGLCTGLGVIGAWCFAWTAATQGQFLVASIGFLASGASLGFLPFNFPKASAFLGDAGSHLVGYLLAVLAILPHFYSKQTPETLGVLKPLLILGVLLGDLVWVVGLRWRLGRPFYLGDTNHLSHRLVRHGLSQTQAVLVIWLLAAVLGALSLV